MTEDEDKEPAPPVRVRAHATAAESRTVGKLTAIIQQALECERLMVSLLPPSAITLQLQERYGMTRRQARAYQAGVRRLWQRQDGYEGRDQRIAKYRRSLEQQAEAAGREGDRRSAIAALAVLIRLDGDEQPSDSERRVPVDASKPALVVSRQELSAAIMARREQENTE